MAYVIGIADKDELAALESIGYELMDPPIEYALLPGEGEDGEESVCVFVDRSVTDLLSPALCPFCRAITYTERSKERNAVIHSCLQCGAKVVIVRGNV